MVRVGSLLDLEFAKETIYDSKTGMTAQDQLRCIYRAVPGLLERKKRIYAGAMAELGRWGIRDMEPEALTAEESAALQAHLDACPDCRETWRQLHELDALLQESELEPPAALHDGVMRAIRQEQKRKPRRAWLPAAAIAAAAARGLLAGKAGLIALPGFEQTDVISVNIGSAVEQIFAQTGAEAPDEAAAQQAAELSAETGLDVLLVWNSGVPAELETAPCETAQSGARL